MVKPALVAVTLSVLALGACSEGRVSSAHFGDREASVDIEYILVGAHAYLAEFHRTLRVTFPRTRTDFPLEMDTGGYLVMNVYRLPQQRLLLSDGEDYVLVDSKRETVEQLAAPPDDVTPEYVGCFDSPDGSPLQFIPLASRPERKPLVRRDGS
jgi:hypothetical protein